MIIRDQINRQIELSETPQKIVSLVPSITELLCWLGLEKQLVGITRYCVHPKGLLDKVKVVGGSKKASIPAIQQLEPDLIIANKEETAPEMVAALEKDFPVWVSEVKTLADCYAMVKGIAAITSTTEKGERLINSLIEELHQQKHLGSVVYLIWKEPYMAAGNDTFIHQMLSVAGFENLILQKRYPQYSIDELQQLQPDFLFLSSEPYPFKKEEVLQWQKRLPATKIALVDGEIFSWYGSRLFKASAYFEDLHKQLLL